MNRHNKEPWTQREHVPGGGLFVIETPGAPYPVAVLSKPNKETADMIGKGHWERVRGLNPAANARRIVACVNICAGIDTADLEAHADLISAHGSTEISLRERLDELLALLEAFPGFVDDATVGDAWVERVHALVTAAKGEAPPT